MIEDNYYFTKFDSIGHDHSFVGKKPVFELMKIAEKNPDIVGFNTLGFMKFKIDKLVRVNAFSEQDGLYILKNRCNIEYDNDIPLIKIINLDRRKDRWDNISFILNSLGLSYERFSATDGKKT